jgi:signal transduction histidine kinase
MTVRTPPIRFQISVLLLMSTLNTVLLALGAASLFATIAASPSGEVVSAVKAFDLEFTSAHAEALDAVVKGQPLPDTTEEKLVSAESRLAPLGAEAATVHDDMEAYLAQLTRWKAHVASPSHSAQYGIEDADGIRISRDLQRASIHVVNGARQLTYFTRPAWVDAFEPMLPLAGLWVVICSVVTVVLAGGLRIVLSRPLEKLTASADRIARGQFDVAIPAPEGAVEIQTLAVAIAAARARTVETIESLDIRNRQTATMLAQLSDGVVLTDAQGAVVESNQQAEATFATLSAEWPRKRTLPDLIPELFQAWFSGEDDHQVSIERVVAGRRLWFDISMRRVPRASARVGGVWVVVLRDVTTAREVDNIKRDFLSVITHELKTPLVTIEGFTKLLLMNKGGELSDKQRGWVQNIRDQGRVLLTMVTNLLDATRIEGGNLTVTTQPVPAADLVAQWTATWKPVVETRGLKFNSGAEGVGGARVAVDTFRMAQVVGNLVNNALKFTKAPGEISIEGTREGERVVFVIRDSGRGIPADAIPYLFDKFYQVEKGDTRVAGGAGLGLYIVHQLVTAQNGRVVVQSDVGQGSRFLVSFPALRPSEPSP